MPHVFDPLVASSNDEDFSFAANDSFNEIDLLGVLSTNNVDDPFVPPSTILPYANDSFDETSVPDPLFDIPTSTTLLIILMLCPILLLSLLLIILLASTSPFVSHDSCVGFFCLNNSPFSQALDAEGLDLKTMTLSYRTPFSRVSCS